MSANALKTIATGKTANPVATFHDLLESRRSEIQKALPIALSRQLTPDRVIRLAMTEFQKTPALQKCTVSSIYQSLLQAAQLGLEIGVAGQAYLVPYFNSKAGKHECQLIPGYKGLLALARRSGEVTSIETHVVYANDRFNLRLGLDTMIEHEPYLDGPRGAARLVYGVAKFKDGGHHFEWMSIEEINRIRARSKASAHGPWVTDYDQMVRKTLIRRMVNYLPMSNDLVRVIDISDAADAGKIVGDDGSVIEMEAPAPDLTLEGEGSAPADAPAEPSTNGAPKMTYAKLMERFLATKDVDVLDSDSELISLIADKQMQEELVAAYQKQRAALTGKATSVSPPPA